MKLLWYFKKSCLVVAWLCRDWLFSPRRQLHFSESAWEKNIRRFMRFTKHRITFAPLQQSVSGKADFVVPLDMEDVYYMANNAIAFPGNKIPAPNADTVRLFHDKAAFNNWLLASRFAKMALQSTTNPPFFLKPREGAWGDDCIVINDENKAAAHAEKIRCDAFIKTEILYSKFEYATHIVFDEGHILAELCIRYEFGSETAVKGVDSPKSITVVRDRYLDKWTCLLQETRFSGICCINYKLIGDHPKIMEINPRFGGSLAEYFFAFIHPLGKRGIPE